MSLLRRLLISEIVFPMAIVQQIPCWVSAMSLKKPAHITTIDKQHADFYDQQAISMAVPVQQSARHARKTSSHPTSRCPSAATKRRLNTWDQVLWCKHGEHAAALDLRVPHMGLSSSNELEDPSDNGLSNVGGYCHLIDFLFDWLEHKHVPPTSQEIQSNSCQEMGSQVALSGSFRSSPRLGQNRAGTEI